MSFNIEQTNYFTDGGLVVAVGATTVEQTGMKAGETYEFVASWPCVCRWGAEDASAADAGFDFAVPAGVAVRATCPTGDSAINIIEASAESHASATCLISRVKIQ